jgi:hypothetical protein
MVEIPDIYKNIKVFIYCGGKCGSMTLVTTFNQYYKSLHVHLNVEFYVTSKQTKFSIFDVIEYNTQTQDQIYIIDCYRTPIERKISSFFENINIHLPNYKKHTLKSVVKYFNAGYIYNLEEYHSIDEIMTHYNLPLFDTFDFEKKYNLLVYKNINFIKIHFSDIDNWGSILSNLFNKKIEIKPSNLSETKHYTELYNKFKSIYYLPNLYYNSYLPKDKNFKIYNTEEEQKIYFEKWSKRLLPGK